jgi:hypothetical protein
VFVLSSITVNDYGEASHNQVMQLDERDSLYWFTHEQDALIVAYHNGFSD